MLRNLWISQYFPLLFQTILGALFHDIGHLAGQERGWPHMTTDGKVLGVERHEEVGEMYLQELGFPDSVSCFSRGHVDAKRYLTYKDDNYRKSKNLSIHTHINIYMYIYIYVYIYI